MKKITERLLAGAVVAGALSPIVANYDSTVAISGQPRISSERDNDQIAKDHRTLVARYACRIVGDVVTTPGIPEGVRPNEYDTALRETIKFNIQLTQSDQAMVAAARNADTDTRNVIVRSMPLAFPNLVQGDRLIPKPGYDMVVGRKNADIVFSGGPEETIDKEVILYPLVEHSTDTALSVEVLTETRSINTDENTESTSLLNQQCGSLVRQEAIDGSMQWQASPLSAPQGDIHTKVFTYR